MDLAASTARWKRLTLGIDFFDPGLTHALMVWKACLRLLQDVSDHERIEAIEDRIQSPELTEAEGLELVSYLEQHRKQVWDYYAPSQRMITAFIKKICGL